MTKNEYVEKKDLTTKCIRLLYEQNYELDLKYIESNKIFEIGEKVIIQESNEKYPIGTIFYIRGYDIWRNQVNHLFFESKKDGSISKNTAWFHPQPKLKKAE